MQENKDKPSFPSLQVTIGLIVVGAVLAAITALSAQNLPAALQFFFGELMILVPTAIYLTRKKYDVVHVFRLRAISPQLLLISLAMAVSAPVLIDELDRLVSIFIKIPEETAEMLADLMVANTLWEALLLIFSTVVLAGVLEEVLFRGMLLQSLERKLELPYAIFISALIFGFFHPLPWLLQIIVLGSFLAFLSWRTNSVFPGILLHGMNNLYAYLYLNLSESALNWYEWNGHVYPPCLLQRPGLHSTV